MTGVPHDGPNEAIQIRQRANVALNHREPPRGGNVRRSELRLAAIVSEDARPAAAKESAVARPIPQLEPVTTATFAANLLIAVPSVTDRIDSVPGARASGVFDRDGSRSGAARLVPRRIRVYPAGWWGIVLPVPAKQTIPRASTILVIVLTAIAVVCCATFVVSPRLEFPLAPLLKATSASGAVVCFIAAGAVLLVRFAFGAGTRETPE